MRMRLSPSVTKIVEAASSCFTVNNLIQPLQIASSATKSARIEFIGATRVTNSVTGSGDGPSSSNSCTALLATEQTTCPRSDSAATVTSDQHTIDTVTTSSTSSSFIDARFSAPTTKQSPCERLQKSRERNRVHARKTRQRKKEQMQLLQNQADELKQEQVRLKQTINEKNTASILVGLFCNGSSSELSVEDPRVEALLRRPSIEIPDASKLPELPALILPGQHNSKKLKNSNPIDDSQDLPDDGIDYDLLGKDRSKCSAAELDKIRRERNRMHAKRTRDRKRLFMDEMADMCKSLEAENSILQRHLDELNSIPSQATEAPTHSVVSPALSSTPAAQAPPPIAGYESTMPSSKGFNKRSSAAPVSQHGVTFDQIKTLLEAAGSFSPELSTSAVSASTNASDDRDSLSDHDDNSSCKRRRLNESGGLSTMTTVSVPQSITTNAPTTVGC